MKNKRQDAIIELIRAYEIETQGELARLLKENGFKVTQATVSRDIRDLRLVKVLSNSGSYKYAVVEKAELMAGGVPISLFTDTLIGVETAGEILVVHTLSGSANAAAEALESLNLQEIVGTVAGDNTIFIAIREGCNGREVMRMLRRLEK